MKFKNLFQVLTLLALVFSMFGASQSVSAAAEPVVVSYNMTVWNATYSGTVNAARYEQWTFSLTETTSFVVTATITSGDLVPLLTLSGTGITGSGVPGEGTVSATLPPGDYSILVQPQSGSGSYSFTLRVATPSDTAPASLSLEPTAVDVDGTSIVTVSLNAVPADGYASAEFTCSYDPAFVEVSEIAESGLFGSDAVVVVNGPAGGSFIFAIAGSNGQKAMTNGAVFTFKAKGLQVGETPIACSVRVSTGNNLVAIESQSATLTIKSPTGTLAGKVVASKLVKVCAYDASAVEVACVDANVDGTFSMTLEAGEYTVAASAEGFLSAEGSATVTGGAETLMPAQDLLAGDIDGDGDVDQFDAMTIGMSYNMPIPAAADLNNDANIDVLDLELLAANYRKTGPSLWQ